MHSSSTVKNSGSASDNYVEFPFFTAIWHFDYIAALKVKVDCETSVNIVYYTFFHFFFQLIPLKDSVTIQAI